MNIYDIGENDYHSSDIWEWEYSSIHGGTNFFVGTEKEWIAYQYERGDVFRLLKQTFKTRPY